MRKSIILAFLFACGMLALTACQAAEPKVEEIPRPTATQVAFVDDEELIEEPVKIKTETVNPTPTATEEHLLVDEELDCAETFCSWPWSGWIERPIGLGNTRTIDRSYPYASTGGGNFDLHHGVEFLNPQGTAILAVEDGVVVFAGFDSDKTIGPYWGFYGKVVILRHPELIIDGQVVYTLYAHLSEILVTGGNQVITGETIGKVGFSGAAIGPHLHFEVRVGMNDYAHTVNPVLWFAPLDDPDNPNLALLAGVILDPAGNPVPELPLTLEHIPESGAADAFYYPKTYYATGVNQHPLLGENFSVSDLPAGDYRLSFIYNQLYDFDLTLEPGSLGFIKVQLD